MANGKLLSIWDAAQDERVRELGISYHLLRGAVKTGQLRTVKISTKAFVPPKALDDFVESISNPIAELHSTAA